MGQKEIIYHFYVNDGGRELCYNVAVQGELSKAQQKAIKIYFKLTPNQKVMRRPRLTGRNVREIGPFIKTETDYSSNAVMLLKDTGFPNVTRVEVTRRIVVAKILTDEEVIARYGDRMRECVYDRPIQTFEVAEKEDPLIIVPALGQTLELMQQANTLYRLGMDKPDLEHFHRLFNLNLRRNPTREELDQSKEMISDHSRHRTFDAEVWIDGVKQPYTLMELVQAPYLKNPGNTIIGFHDNASAIYGGSAMILMPDQPGWPSLYVVKRKIVHPTITIETHCYPTGICAWPGAETGIGGDLRDDLAKGRGGTHLYAIAGFMTGNLWIPGYIMPWEKKAAAFNATNMESPFKIMVDAPGGNWSYANRYGIPLYQGITRTFGMNMPNGDHYAYWKPVMMAGMIGTMFDEHTKKGEARKGLKIVAIGGPGFIIGYGGGSGSSSGTSDKNADLDYNAVQRGNAAMGHLTWEVIRACVEMGLQNPIISIHDQGAAGVCNVITELVEKAGGRVKIREINLGDKTMSVLEIWICEYQERYGLLIHPDHLQMFKEICEREGCPCEELGEVTGDGRIVVYDSKTDTVRVDLPIKEICSGLPRKVIKDVSPEFLGGPVKIPKNMTLKRAIRDVLRLPSVCSKEFHVHHVDGSVTGLRVQAQQCGPLHLPVSDFAISSVDFQGSFGVVSAIGECAPKMMLNSPKGARMAVAEMLGNLSGVQISNLEDIKLSVNWMWAAKGIKGGVAKMYLAMESLKGSLEVLRIAGIGGKDSSSLFVEVQMVITKSPETLVLTALVTVPNITKFVTSDIKHPGRSRLLLIDTANGYNRLGGSAFLQTLSQLGDECPDVDMKLAANAFLAEQELIRKNLITAGHDRTGDGGLFVNLMEMLAAGDCGAQVNFSGDNLYGAFFAEEAGKIIEYLPENEETIMTVLNRFNLPYQYLGYTTESKDFAISFNGCTEFCNSIVELRHQWRETSYQMEKHRLNPKYALAERRNTKHAGRPNYKLTFSPYFPAVIGRAKPPVAIIRTKVSTGQRETAAGLMQYFDPHDVHVSDLLTGKARLNDYLGIFKTPGFSFQDIFGAGKGFAMQFLRNPRLMDQFAEFKARKNTFFSGSCNGCQDGAWLEVLGLPQVNGYPPLLFVQNDSRDFEHRFVNLEILDSPSILFKGMAGSRIGAWVAHGEGKVWLADKETEKHIRNNHLVTMAYVDDQDRRTVRYPFNPNGSINGWTGFCDKTGRFNIYMPHLFDRSFLMRQWPWIPPEFKGLGSSPWVKSVQNLREWCDEN